MLYSKLLDISVDGKLVMHGHNHSLENRKYDQIQERAVLVHNFLSLWVLHLLLLLLVPYLLLLDDSSFVAIFCTVNAPATQVTIVVGYCCSYSCSK